MRHLGTRSSVNRTLLWVFLGVAVAGTAAATVALIRAVRQPGPPKTVEAFLSAVRDGRFHDAYDRLCPGPQSSEDPAAFTSRLQRAREIGEGLADYQYTIPFDRESLSARVALGTATLTNGSHGDLTVEIGKSESGGCVASWLLGPTRG